MDAILADLPEVYVKGKLDAKSFEIKSIGGDILMSGTCNYSSCGGPSFCGGWPEERFTLKQANGNLALELKGEADGNCNCGGNGLNTEVCTSYGSAIGFLKGTPSKIHLTTTSNDVLGEVYSAGFLSSNKTITVNGREGKFVSSGTFNCSKYLVTFPDTCSGNSKALIVAAALEMLWKSIQDRTND